MTSDRVLFRELNHIFLFLQRFSRQICFVTHCHSSVDHVGSNDIDWHHYFTYRLGILPKGENNDIKHNKIQIGKAGD